MRWEVPMWIEWTVAGIIWRKAHATRRRLEATVAGCAWNTRPLDSGLHVEDEPTLEAIPGYYLLVCITKCVWKQRYYSCNWFRFSSWHKICAWTMHRRSTPHFWTWSARGIHQSTMVNSEYWACINNDFLDFGCALLPRELMAETEDEVIDSIYGNGAMRVEDADDVKDSCILTPLNDASLEINHKVYFNWWMIY